MKNSSRLILPSLVVACALLTPLSASAQLASSPKAMSAPSNEWQFSISPYLWLPSLEGEFKYAAPPGASGSPTATVGPTDYDLSGFFMMAGDMRKGKWSAMTDFMYLSIGNQSSAVASVDFGGSSVVGSVSGSANSDLKAYVWTMLGGYSVWSSPKGNLDLLGGVRYLGLDLTTNWNLSVSISGPGGGGASFPASGTVSGNQDIWNGVVGLRGRVRLGEGNWSLPYYADFGGGSNTTSWQLLGGIAYSYGWGDVELSYRHLEYDQGDDHFVQSLSLSGFALAANFRF